MKRHGAANILCIIQYSLMHWFVNSFESLVFSPLLHCGNCYEFYFGLCVFTY